MVYSYVHHPARGQFDPRGGPTAAGEIIHYDFIQ